MRLQTKLLIILAMAFLIAFCVQQSYSYRHAHQDVLTDLKREARNIRGVLMATRRVYHHQFLNSGIPLTEKTVGFLPAHSMNRISSDFENWSDSGLNFNNVSDRPRNPDNKADPLEMEAINYFRENPTTQERFAPYSTDAGESYYHYSRPIWVEQYCIKCHGKREDAPATIRTQYSAAYDYQVGDLRGIMSIKLPAALAQERATASLWRALWTDFVSYVGIFILVYWGLVRYVARRLNKLSDSCGKLAEGDYSARSNITGKDEIGHVAAVFNGMAEKIEERDAALHASEQHKHKIVDTAHDAYIAIDSHHVVTDWNKRAEQIFGWSRDEILGQLLTETIIPPQYRDEHHKAMKRLLDNGKLTIADRRVEFSALHRDGHEFPVELAITQVRSGQTRTFNAFVRDITERKRVEAEFILAKEMAESSTHSKSEFLANMSHEIRTPMTAILGFAENLQDSDMSEPDRNESVETIRRNGESLLAIINDILDLSKIEAGKMEVEHITCNVCQIIADVASLMYIRANEKGLSFNIEYTGLIPETIVSDPTRIRQILINLLSNAIKFTEEGTVTLIVQFVSVSQDQGAEHPNETYIQFEVLDTGMGIDDEQAATLFHPFTQADASSTRKFGGTGLGLTISKRFAELLGGEITLVESKIGVGTRFRATIKTGLLENVKMLDHPSSATVVPDAISSAEKISPTDMKGVCILLAEDCPDNQRLISLVLQKAGADVTIVENGKLAHDVAMVSHAKGNPFEVILMDIQMPVMDGYTATSQLRQSGYIGPIIALTAHAMEGDREKCIQAGCDDYMTKPINRTKLIEMIQKHLVPAEVAS